MRGRGRLSIAAERRFVTAGVSEQRWNEGKCRRRGRGTIGGHRFVNISLGRTLFLPPDNKFDLISIVLQVPLGYESERQTKKEEEEEGRRGAGDMV